MAWRQIGDKPLSEAMLARITTGIFAALGGDELRWLPDVFIQKSPTQAAFEHVSHTTLLQGTEESISCATIQCKLK